ncbi:CD83 antigen [Rhineura floridana]|uniref:CD83 antigen n=1 Tax=Rhineura floridana TaxID=261503 RepID=UPI002AC87DE0|nr:CD83 antigen [Rhineura floridana]
MAMASIYCYQLVFLSQVWHVVHGVADATEQVVAACGKDVLLPCKHFQEQQVTYGAISWYKIGENGEEWKELQYNKEHEYSRELNETLEVSNGTRHSLKITNTTSHNSGTYKCIIRSPVKEYIQSNKVTLKVTDCPEDANLQKYRTELVLLCSLGFFYLLLIFFTCVCIKDDAFSNYHKSREKHIDNRHCPISTC